LTPGTGSSTFCADSKFCVARLGRTENREFSHLKTDRARAHLGAAWRILEKALRGASVRVRRVRALFLSGFAFKKAK